MQFSRYGYGAFLSFCLAVTSGLLAGHSVGPAKQGLISGDGCVVCDDAEAWAIAMGGGQVVQCYIKYRVDKKCDALGRICPNTLDSSACAGQTSLDECLGDDWWEGVGSPGVGTKALITESCGFLGYFRPQYRCHIGENALGVPACVREPLPFDFPNCPGYLKYPGGHTSDEANCGAPPEN